MMDDFDFDVEFEEAILNEKKLDKKVEKKSLFPEMKIRGAKAPDAKQDLDNQKDKDKSESKGPTTEELFPKKEEEQKTLIYTLRTTANREDQVMDFVTSNVVKKGLAVYSVVRPHGMRGYIFMESETKEDAEQAVFGIPYARGILPQPVPFKEIEHMLEQVKVQTNIKKNDIVEIISGPFRREKAKVTRIDQSKDDVVVELLEAAVPIPMTLKLDAVKVVRRDEE